MVTKVSKNETRLKRHLRIRQTLNGTQERPRLVVFRSNKHIYAQIINDAEHNTLVAASTVERDIAGKIKSGSNKEAAKLVGASIARKAAEKGITEVIFDRGGYLYHGRVQELADAAREGGLQF